MSHKPEMEREGQEPCSTAVKAVDTRSDILINPSQDRLGPEIEEIPVNAEPVVTNSPQRSKTMELTDQTNLLPARVALPILCGLVLCTMVSQLDTSVVATALPSIASHFNAGTAHSIPLYLMDPAY